MKRAAYLALLFVLSTLSRAQEFTGIEAYSKVTGADKVYYKSESTYPRYIHFKIQEEFNSLNPDKKFQNTYKLKESYGFRLHSVWNDALNQTHFKYQVYYQEIPVEGSFITAHTESNNLLSLSSTLYILSGKPLAAIDSSQAIRKALDNRPADTFMWELPQEELLLKEIVNANSATYYPQPELVWFPSDLHRLKEEWVLAYRMKIYASSPLFHEQVYVDATSGEVLFSENLLHDINVTGTAETKYSGTKQIHTDSLSSGLYRLRDSSQGIQIITLDMNKSSTYSTAVDFIDSNNYWNTINTNQDEVATDAHWGAERTYHFYLDNFGRNSFDNNGAGIRNYVHYKSNYNNAFWNGYYMTYGDGNGTTFTPLVSLDVCGHEISHAVTTYTANLIYSYESGALNESFSDIFGNSIEFENKSSASWKIGEEIVPNGSGLRNMQKPKLKGDPDTYQGQYWYSGSGDNGGVHTNSGVQNYWYYVLCEGDTGTNDDGDFFTVDSIGRPKAQQIAYRSLSTYLGRFSDYEEARYFSILAARDLYGDCSPEVTATTNAWFATGVGAEFDSTVVEAAFIADSFYCFAPALVNFTNLSTNAISYVWDFGDGKSDTLSNPSHTYTADGNFDVELIARNCFGYSSDTLLSTNYILVDSTPDICHALQLLDTGVYYANYCRGFIYDAGGESSYPDLSSSYTIIQAKGADSISFSFSEFDYEKDYDYLYIYEGIGSGGNLIGKFTGSTLPFNGDTIYVQGENLTIRHSSDPAVVGTGFKLWFETYRTGPQAFAPNDSSLCIGDTAIFTAKFSNVDSSVMAFHWIDSLSNTILAEGPEFAIAPTGFTTYGLIVHDVCTESMDTAWFHLDLLAPLSIQLPTDTLLCSGQEISLLPHHSGGSVANHQIYWIEEGLTLDSLVYTGVQDTVLHAVLSDGCTYLRDTASIIIQVLSPLEVVLTGDTLVCNSAQAGFKATAQGGKTSDYSFLWNQSGAPDADSINITANGSVWISVELSDFCSAEKAKDSIQLQNYSTLLIQASNDTSFCYGQGGTAAVSILQGNFSNPVISWNTSVTDSIIQIDPLMGGTYIVEVNDICEVQTDTVDITILPPLQLDTKLDTLICKGESLIRSFEAHGGKSASYSFEWNDGFNGDIRTWTPIATSSYQVKVEDGCSLPDSIQFTVNQRDALTVDAGADIKICYGDKASFIAVASGGFSPGYSYLWTSNSSTSPVLVYYPTLSEWQVIKVSDNCSQEVVDSVFVEVDKPVFPSITLSDSLLCLGESIEITAQGSYLTLLMTLSDGNSSNLSPWNFTPTSIGKFDLEVEVENATNCKLDSLFEDAFEVIQPANAKFSLNQKQFILEEDQLQAQYTGTGAVSWFWLLSDGTSSNNRDFQFNFEDTGTYILSLEVEDIASCRASISDTISVVAEAKVWMPNSFTPNGDHFNDTYVPRMLSISTYSMKVFDRWGSLVYECSDNATCEWDGNYSNGNPAPAGVYAVVFVGDAIPSERIERSESVLLIR